MPSALFDESAPSARLVPPGAQAAPTHARAPPEQLGSLRWPPQPASGRPKVDESPFHGQVAYHRQSFLIISHHPLLFIGAGLSGFFVNITSFLLVKRTSSMTFKLVVGRRRGSEIARPVQARGTLPCGRPDRSYSAEPASGETSKSEAAGAVFAGFGVRVDQSSELIA